MPTGTVGLASQRTDAIALVLYLRKTVSLPTCFEREVARMDAFFQVTVPPSTINAAHGKFDRSSFEMCMRELIDQLFPQGSRWEREGQLTKITVGANPPQYLGYTTDGWIGWDKTRASLEAWLAAKPEASERLGALIERGKKIEHAALVSLMSNDLSGALLGVPSRGAFFALDESALTDAAGQSVRATVLYESAEVAARAAKAVLAAAANAERPEALRKALGATKPTVQGNELLLDLAPFSADLDAARQATQELSKITGAPAP